jgi:hypothetical protein
MILYVTRVHKHIRTHTQPCWDYPHSFSLLAAIMFICTGPPIFKSEQGAVCPCIRQSLHASHPSGTTHWAQLRPRPSSSPTALRRCSPTAAGQGIMSGSLVYVFKFWSLTFSVVCLLQLPCSAALSCSCGSRNDVRVTCVCVQVLKFWSLTFSVVCLLQLPCSASLSCSCGSRNDVRITCVCVQVVKPHIFYCLRTTAALLCCTLLQLQGKVSSALSL